MRLLLAAALLAATASAQTDAPVVLAPGHPDLDVAAVTPQTQVVLVRMVEPQVQAMGSVRDDVRLADGVLTVVTSTRVGMAGPPVRDSTRFAWPSLAPVAHVVETDGRAGVVAYGTSRVEGTWGEAGSPSPLASDLDRPVFAPAALPYVIRALPLDRPGYRALVPLFSVKDRFQEATLTVVGPEAITLDDGTEVEAVAVDQAGGGGLTRGFAQRHVVDPATREILRTTLRPQQGMTVQIDPLPSSTAATVRPIRARSSQPAVALVPGHPDLAMDRMTTADAATEMRYVLPEPRSLWQITETVTRDGETLTVAMAAASPNDSTRTVRDTTRYRWPSLEPLSHHRVTTGPEGESVESLAFDGLHATGAHGTAGAAPLPLDIDLPGPVFGPRSVPLVVRALPFRPGYLATVPVFTASDRLGERTLTVVGRDDVETSAGTVSAWIVEEEGDGPTRVYAVHPETRDLLSVTYSPSPGSLIETARR